LIHAPLAARAATVSNARSANSDQPARSETDAHEPIVVHEPVDGRCPTGLTLASEARAPAAARHIRATCTWPQRAVQEYAKTLRQYGRRIVRSGSAYAEVQRVARRIEAVAGRDKPDFVWKVTLLRKNEANAYCPAARSSSTRASCR
jgi:hypothetical protein